MRTLSIVLALASSLFGSPIPDFPFIYVQGDASEYVPTSLVTIKFHVLKSSRSSVEAEKALGDSSKAIKEALRGLGVENPDINASEILKRQETGEFPPTMEKEGPGTLPDLRPLDEKEESKKPKDKETFFTVEQQFVLRIKNLKLYPNLAQYLMRSNDVTRFDVEFSATNRKEIIGRLRKAAFADARQSAEDIAKASGEKLGRIHSASEMPYSALGHLVGEDSGSNSSYGAAIPNEVYEVPPTVFESFEVNVLFRLDQGTPSQSEQAAPSNGDKPSN